MKFPTCALSFGLSRHFCRILALTIAPGVLALTAYGQVSCTTSAAVTAVASTGLAEQVGTITLQCTGGTAGTVASGDLLVTLNTNITNALDGNGNPLNVSVNATGAAITYGQVNLVTAKEIDIPSITYTIPNPSSTPVNVTISGIRGAVGTIQNGLPATVTVSLHWIGFNFSGSPFTVASGFTPLLSSVEYNVVPCAGSPLPASIDFPDFLYAGTASSAVRVTEALTNAFSPLGPGETNGVRIIVQMSGYPAGTQLYVPTALVGSTGTYATSAGEFGVYPYGGVYTPSGQLLLSLVNGADQTGTGGTLAISAPTTQTTFAGMTQLTVTGGSAYAVYEVLDHAPGLESVQVPVFESNSAYSCSTAPPPITISAMEAPVSTVSIATMTDPVPRYISAVLGSDCTQVGDCAASYQPVLTVSTSTVNISGSSLGAAQNASVTVTDSGGSAFSFSDSVTYQSGSGWLTATPAAAEDGNNVTIALVANPASLQPGTYNATLTINGGSLGSTSVPVVFTVGSPLPTITAVQNAASLQTGAVAAGSYVALYGTNFTGSNLTVTFNNQVANVISETVLPAPNSNITQVNTIIPASLAGLASVPAVVTVNGVAGPAFSVTLAGNAPGIFTPGIENSDGSVNTASNPATHGTFVAVYLTGLAIPTVAGSVTVNIGSQTGLVPLYAGAQGTEAALDQIDVTIPANLAFTGNSTPLTACITVAAGQQVCSNTVTLYVK